MTNNKGITLIALIITVIILLILAGTAISISINGGNLFEKAATARDTWNLAVANEEEETSKTWQILDGMLPPYKVYTLGQEVVVGGENFFVIEENDDSSKDTITLITKYNLSKTENRQQNDSYSTTAIDFCTDPDSTGKGYWYEEGENASEKYPFELNGTVSENNERAIAYKKVVEYGRTKGGIGRLLTRSEAYGFISQTNGNYDNPTMANIILGKDYTSNGTTDNFLAYWLNMANDSNFVLYVYIGFNNGISAGRSNGFALPGVRPVITVPKSLVTYTTN